MTRSEEADPLKANAHFLKERPVPCKGPEGQRAAVDDSRVPRLVAPWRRYNGCIPVRGRHRCFGHQERLVSAVRRTQLPMSSVWYCMTPYIMSYPLSTNHWRGGEIQDNPRLGFRGCPSSSVCKISAYSNYLHFSNYLCSAHFINQTKRSSAQRPGPLFSLRIFA